MDIKAYYAKRVKYYDMINAFKFRETDEELRFFKRTLKKYNKTVRTILDVGCGTGRHSIPLSEMGFKVVGIDSSKEMLDVARKKIKKSNKNIRLEMADLRTYESRSKFDCVLCADASLAIFIEKGALVKALKNINKNLKESGIFFYDVWNYAEYKDWPPINTWTEKKGDDEMTILRKTRVDSSGIYQFDDVISIKKDGKSSFVLKANYKSKVWRYREWLKIFRESGFKTVRCYSNLKHIKHFKGIPDKLYFVAFK